MPEGADRPLRPGARHDNAVKATDVLRAGDEVVVAYRPDGRAMQSSDLAIAEAPSRAPDRLAQVRGERLMARSTRPAKANLRQIGS